MANKHPPKHPLIGSGDEPTLKNLRILFELKVERFIFSATVNQLSCLVASIVFNLVEFIGFKLMYLPSHG